MPTLSQKKGFVSQLTEDITTANIILLVDYRGLSVAEMTNLRRALSAA
ncbi:MAG: 50S ribosomal protein L10, partial [Vampirovibrionales bacterium]